MSYLIHTHHAELDPVSLKGPIFIPSQEPPTKVDGLIDGIKSDESGGINRFTENKENLNTKLVSHLIKI